MNITKNREREAQTFANINLFGKCNADCYFCLGKDLWHVLGGQNQQALHFSEWPNFEKFINLCHDKAITHLYLTGQNIDSLQYKYFDELRDYLQHKFYLGIRTNGVMATLMLDEIRKLNNTVGYSVHALSNSTNRMIMGVDCPDWDYIIPRSGPNVRVSIVVNRYNYNYTDFIDIIKYLSKFQNVKYIQARRISTDTRMDELAEDIGLYEVLYKKIRDKYTYLGDFYGAQRFNIHGKEVVFWRTVETSVNSLNYFTDGTISDEYFIVEGYLKYYKGNCVVNKKETCNESA